MSQLIALARKDARIVYRDRFLLLLALYSMVLAVVARIGVPWIPVDGLGLYLAPAIVLFGPLLLGTLVGFGLIEEREQGTWLLLRVLPLEPLKLFSYLFFVAGLLSYVVSLASSVLYGLPVVDRWLFALMLLPASLTAPLVMLLLGAFCSNKIEGLAVSKILSTLGLVPALVFVLPMPWQLVAAWCPWYWIYVGLLETFVENSSMLSTVYWPGYPNWLMVVAPIVLTLSGVVPLGRLYMRRAN